MARCLAYSSIEPTLAGEITFMLDLHPPHAPTYTSQHSLRKSGCTILGLPQNLA
jgi:hypothetical protein